MLRFLFLTLLFLTYQIAQAQKIRVAVAANAQFVAQALKAAYEKETKTTVDFVFSSSGKLATQIEQGAPFDVFLSADTFYPNTLYRKGFTQGKPEVYAYGALVIWTTRNLDLTKGLQLIKDPTVKKIAIPNPQLAPYGDAARKAMQHYQLEPIAKPKLVFAESIAQANQYILSGVVDFGFTSKSVVLDPAIKGKGKYVSVNPTVYPPIAQSAVILKSARSRNLAQAQRFYKFLFSARAKLIFKQYGYSLN
ncbi:molybdate ABC transporter substrate-binding protein [Adhaeribacter rhizoryzae]|uniref:Molybdate ABC transporter substrate-binding protein n=1 Tax=Adhaeribacter rhizoryzae TaxID=2607907 RepID=A0A5M6DH16_9BACT|nr:molybdate ABC transporter substrate-binding protein [Adhaeribacter rhizoryzae]KAA5545686.1 molybdate ABC transporter substrate-binding protein [Adhaeribacter rhizoryzae]